MTRKQKSINEVKALKILRKNNFMILPGELMEEKNAIETLEGRFPSFDKEIILSGKKVCIFKYENVINKKGEMIPCMIILENNGQSFIYQSHIRKNSYLAVQ